MAKDAARVQKDCPKCQEMVDINEPSSYNRQEIGDNVISTIFSTNYSLLLALTLPKFGRSFQSSLSRKRNCLEGDPVKSPSDAYLGIRSLWFFEKCTRESGEHQRGSRLSKQVMHLGYCCLTMEADSLSFARRCRARQLHGNRIHAPAAELHNLATPSPFHTWAFDLVGPINPPSRENIWILVAT